MIFYNPVVRNPMPFFHQTASNVSPRDSDATGRQYRKSSTIGQQAAANANALKLVQQYLGRQRRRIVGGGVAAPAPSGGGLNYRGLWTSSPPTPYMENDLVLIQTGAAAGGYISTIDNNGNDPSTGTGWVQWPQTVTSGSWT